MDNNFKNEKLTVNIGTMDLAKIDLLVDNLEYSNRSDFCRIAIRDLLEKHEHQFDKLYEQSIKSRFDTKNPTMGGIGIIKITKDDLEKYRDLSQRVNIMVIGLLIIGSDISSDLFEQTVSDYKVYGKVRVPLSLKNVIRSKKNDE